MRKKLFGVIAGALGFILAGILPARANGRLPGNPSLSQTGDANPPSASNPLPVYPWAGRDSSEIDPTTNPILSPLGESVANPYSQETTGNEEFSNPDENPTSEESLGSEKSATETPW